MKLLSKTLFLITFIFLTFIPQSIQARSGCCSGHSGVNCAAGSQPNGTVICNDGWTGSSCDYAGMVMCGGHSDPPPVVIVEPTSRPTARPTIIYPTRVPTRIPTIRPTSTPSPTLTPIATTTPTLFPTETVTPSPTVVVTRVPTIMPSVKPTSNQNQGTFSRFFRWMFGRK